MGVSVERLAGEIHAIRTTPGGVGSDRLVAEFLLTCYQVADLKAVVLDPDDSEMFERAVAAVELLEAQHVEPTVEQYVRCVFHALAGES